MQPTFVNSEHVDSGAGYLGGKVVRRGGGVTVRRERKEEEEDERE